MHVFVNLTIFTHMPEIDMNYMEIYMNCKYIGSKRPIGHIKCAYSL